MCVYAICLPAFDPSKHHTCDTVPRPPDPVKNQGMHTVDTDHLNIVTWKQQSSSQLMLGRGEGGQ